MAKKEEIKKVPFKDKCKELEKKYNVVDLERAFIPTGSIAYNWALGGGYQTGRIYEFISWEGAGKTTLALHAAAECQNLGLNVMYIDAEHALDRKYAETIGVNWEDMGKFQPDYGEQGFDYIKEILNNGDVSLIVIDSTSGLLPKKMIEDPTGTANLGLHARLLGPELVKLQTLADNSNCAIIIISQFREKIGVMFGCLHGETLVNFVDGRSIAIKKVVEEKIQGNIWSWNEGANKFEEKPIIDWHFNGKVENHTDYIHFETEGINTNNGRFGFTVTPTHEIYSHGWKRAKDLNIGDEILSKYESHFGEYGEEFLKGCFVGDSHLAIRSNNTASLIFEDKLNPDYVQWKIDALSSLKFKKNGKRWESEYTYEFAKWKKKIGRRNPIEVFDNGISWLSLAIWLMDDGHFQKGHKRYSLSVKRFAKDIDTLQSIGKLFSNIGLKFNINKAGTIVFTVGSSIVIAEQIRKYVPSCMEYKLPEWAIDRNKVIEKTIIYSSKIIKETYVKIILKRFASDKQMRMKGKYDISVQDTHNYIVGGINNGIVVHNSPETTQGGNALRFWTSARTELRKELIKEGDDVLGIITKFKVIKNKVVSPYRTGRIPIKFGKGIQKSEELIILGGEYNILKKHGDSVKILKNDQKYKLDEFYDLLRDNEEFKKQLIVDITKSMDNDTTRTELDKTETERI